MSLIVKEIDNHELNAENDGGPRSRCESGAARRTSFGGHSCRGSWDAAEGPRLNAEAHASRRAKRASVALRE